MKKIDLCEFELLTPDATRVSTLAVSVMLDGTVRLNGKLREKFTIPYVNLYTIEDGTVIALKPVNADSPKASYVKANGSLKSHSLKERLEAAKIKLPARYVAEWNEEYGFWQAELDPSYPFTPFRSAPPKAGTGKNSCAKKRAK